MGDAVKEETKKLILSVVTSTPDCVTIATLKKDFRSLVGEEIPYRKLGFDNLEIYLLSLTDTVSIRGRGPDAIVKAYCSEKSAHVENLIANQKKNSGSRYRRPPRHGGNNWTPPRHYNKHHFGGPSPHVPPPGFPMHYSPPQPFYRPPSLMSQYYPPRQMDERYGAVQPQCKPPRSTTSTYQPHKQEQSTSVPSQTSNVDPPVTKAASTSPRLPLHHEVHSTRMGNADKNIKTPAVQTNCNSVSTFKTVMERVSITPTRKLTAIIPAGLESPSEGTNNSYDEGDEIFMDSDDDIPDVPDSPSTSRMSRGNRMEPASVSAVRSVNGNLKDPTTFLYNIRVPREVQDNLVQLVADDERNEGIWCAKLPDIYKDRFGSSLNADQYGFPSLLAMCLELPSIFLCIQIQRGDYKVFDCRKPYPRDTVKMNTFIRKLENLNTTSLVQAANNLSPLPEDHMSADYLIMDDHIPRLDLTTILSEGGDISVRIAEVYDPSKFWLHIVGPDYSVKLTDMMLEMQSFYKDKNKYLAIQKEKMQVGLLCCTIYNTEIREFHRAVIIDTTISKSQLVKVFYLDYGTVSKVPATEILYLHRQFSTLPQQANRARLAGVYPRDAKTPWSRAAGQRFFDLIHDRELFAQIDKINGKRQEMEVFLVDTKYEFDIHISDKLVEEGLAIFTHDEQTPVELDWQLEPIVQYIHLYPTFQELETGRVLTITEMDQLFELNVPYYVAYNHYFCQKEGANLLAIANLNKVLPEVIDNETTLAATIDQTANWVQNIDTTNISDISIAEIEGEPFRRVITIECDVENFLLIRFNSKVYLIVQQLLKYFNKKDLSIIRVLRLCVHVGINIPRLTKQLDNDLFKLSMEHFNTNENVIHLLPVEDVPKFYEKICNEIFSFDVWPNIEKILNFSSDIWVK